MKNYSSTDIKFETSDQVKHIQRVETFSTLHDLYNVKLCMFSRSTNLNCEACIKVIWLIPMVRTS